VSPRLYQRAFEILARQITSGAVPRGARLLESRVTAQFGISRAPARQALAELVRSGLIEKAAGRGYTVIRGGPPAAPDAAGSAPDESIILSSLPTWEKLYAQVEREIAARSAYASWRVNEAKLALHYDVSRTVARDVLGRLQQRGLVRKDERSRWYAPALSPTHVGELYELRWVLEPLALAKAAPNVPRDYLTQIRRSLEDAIEHADAIEGETLDRLEQELHVTLLGYSGNFSLMQAITLPQSLLIAHRFLYRWTARLFETEPFLGEHLAVIERLEHGKATEAAQALEEHLKASRERAIARIDVVAKAFHPDPLPYLNRIGEAA
jgi:DNA-binding GntR family transcriptional regulator